jgi:transcriptional antiterminator RfaH
MMRWLVVYTKPRLEFAAQEHLGRQGFEVLCPLLRVQKLRRRKWLWIEEPLFPRYLFVGASKDQSWAPIRSTVGVSSIVRFGGIYAEVSDQLIDAFRAGNQEPAQYRPLFEKGQKLRIVAGPYASLQGVFDLDEGGQRAAVLLDLLGRQSRAVVDINQLISG